MAESAWFQMGRFSTDPVEGDYYIRSWSTDVVRVGRVTMPEGETALYILWLDGTRTLLADYLGDQTEAQCQPLPPPLE